MRWLDRLAHFDILIEYTAGRNSNLTDYMSKNPTEKPSNEESYGEEYVINMVSELLKLYRKDGQLLNKHRPKMSNDGPIAEYGFNDEPRNSFRTINRKNSRANEHKQLDQSIRRRQRL